VASEGRSDLVSCGAAVAGDDGVREGAGATFLVDEGRLDCLLSASIAGSVEDADGGGSVNSAGAGTASADSEASTCGSCVDPPQPTAAINKRIAIGNTNALFQVIK